MVPGRGRFAACGPPDGGPTMFVDAIGRAIAAAPLKALDHLGREVWAAHGAKLLDDAETSAALEAIQARHKHARPKHAEANPLLPAASYPKPRPRRPQSPDRRASIERRRRLVASGPLPPAMAARFTWGEQAVMRIVGDECRQHGTCSLHVDAIAARAGVHRTTVQNALREAQGRSGNAPLVHVQERRRKGQRSLTNIIKVVSTEWAAWLRRGPRRVGSNCTVTTPSSASNCTSIKNLSTTDTSKKEREVERTAASNAAEAISRGKKVALR
jgi:hypothetical protein